MNSAERFGPEFFPEAFLFPDRFGSDRKLGPPPIDHLRIQVKNAFTSDILRRRDQGSHAIVNKCPVLWINPQQQIPKRHAITRPRFTQNGRESCCLVALIVGEIELGQRRAEQFARIFKVRRAWSNPTPHCTGGAGGNGRFTIG